MNGITEFKINSKKGNICYELPRTRKFERAMLANSWSGDGTWKKLLLNYSTKYWIFIYVDFSLHDCFYSEYFASSLMSHLQNCLISCNIGVHLKMKMSIEYNIEIYIIYIMNKNVRGQHIYGDIECLSVKHLSKIHWNELPS